MDVYNEMRRHDQPKLRLIKTVQNEVELVIVNSNGERRHLGRILRILENGKIYLFNNVNPEWGFNLDNEGRVIISGEFRSEEEPPRINL